MAMLLTLLLALVSACPVQATAFYTFSGENGLSGTLTLDDTTPFAITLDPIFGTYAELKSSLNHISGVFGDSTFEGTPFLAISDLPDTFFNAQNSWIVRADIFGPSINGLTPTKLNLFVYRSAAGTMPISLTPPVPDADDVDPGTGATDARLARPRSGRDGRALPQASVAEKVPGHVVS
jgi:hypothetical protein